MAVPIWQQWASKGLQKDAMRLNNPRDEMTTPQINKFTTKTHFESSLSALKLHASHAVL